MTKWLGIVQLGSGLLLAAVLAAGCQKPSQSPVTPTTAAPPAPSAPLAPLSEKALLPLQQLAPPVAKPVSTTQPKPPGPQAAEAQADAQKRLAKGDVTGAIEKLERAASFEPLNPAIQRALGMAYASISDFGKAGDHLRQAVKLAPDDLESQLMLARLLASQKRDDQAIQTFRLALACSDAKPENPAAAEATLRLGMLLQENGYWTAALDCYTQLAQWIQKYGANYSSRAIVADLALRPEKLQTRRGQLLLLLRRPAEAVEQLQASYNANRTDLATARLLLEGLTAVGQFRRAEKLLVELASDTSQAAQLSMLAESLCRASGDPAMPGRIWSAFRQKKSIDAGLAVSLADISQRLGQPPQAMSILTGVWEAMPGDIRVGSRLAVLLARQGQVTQAMAMLVRVIEADAAWPFASDELTDGVRQIAQIMDAKQFKLLCQAYAPASQPASSSTTGPTTQVAKAVVTAAATKSTTHPSTAPAAAAAQIYLCGLLAQAKGENALALDLFSAAVAADGASLKAREALVELALAQNQLPRAKAAAASASEPYFAGYLRAKIALAGPASQVPQAVKELEAARKANKEFVPTLILLADAYIKQRKVQDAAGLLFEALELDGDQPMIYRKLFTLYLNAGHLDDAQNVVAKFLEVQPQSIQGLIMLTELKAANNQPAAAASVVAQLLEQSPNNPQVQVLAARTQIPSAGAMIDHGQFDKALAYLAAAVKADPFNATALQIKAQLLAMPGQFSQAAAVWNDLYRMQPGKTEFAKAAAAAYLVAHDYNKSLEILDKLLAVEPSDMSLRQAQADCLIKQGKFAAALAMLKQRLAADGGKSREVADWYRMRILATCEMALTAKPAPKDGVDYCTEALAVIDQSLNGASVETRVALHGQKVRFLGLAKRYDDAIKFVNDISSYIQDAKLLPQGALIGILSDGKQYAKAQEQLDQWIPRVAKDPVRSDWLRQLKIAIWGEAGQMDQARMYGDLWIVQEPNSLAPRQAIIAALASDKKYDQAAKLLGEWISQLPPQEPTSRPTTGPVRAATSRAASGPASAPASRATRTPPKLTKSAKSKPTTLGAASKPTNAELGAWMRQALIRMLMMQQKYDEALRQADRALSLDGEDPELLGLKSGILSELGRQKEALEALEKILTIQDDASNNNNLGYLYAVAGVNLDKAEKMLRKAVAERPTEASFLDSLAWILYKQGRIGEAGGLLRRVIMEELPASLHPVIFDHAGDCYWRLGWTDSAVEFWTKAVDLAGKEKIVSTEIKQVLATCPAKIKAVRAGKTPAVAPLATGK